MNVDTESTESIPNPYAGQYAELHCHSAFSLLDGASLPEQLVTRAASFGYQALALTDHDEMGASCSSVWQRVNANSTPSLAWSSQYACRISTDSAAIVVHSSYCWPRRGKGIAIFPRW